MAGVAIANGSLGDRISVKRPIPGVAGRGVREQWSCLRQ